MGQYRVTFGQRILLAGTSKVLVDATTEVEFRDENEKVVPVPKQVVDISMATISPSGPRSSRKGRQDR